jgi:hypothetical protein
LSSRDLRLSSLRYGRYRGVRLGLAIIVAWVVPHAALEAQELTRSVRLTVDNDYFNFWLPPLQRPDDNYTQGARIAWDLASTPRFARALLCPSGVACGTTVEIGQEMYTPSADWPAPGDRPYAGWLYGRVEVRGGRPRMMRRLDITIGLTGPPSLAEAAQTGFHRLAGFRQPVGWEHQLPTEVGIGIRAAQSWRIAPAGSAGRRVDLVPTVSAAAGTLRTAVAAGARARVGARLPHPWLMSELASVAPYGFVGLEAEAVARDLFLDGTVFRPSVRVTHAGILAKWEWGGGVHFRRFCLEYRAVTRTREYVSGPRSRTFGSVAASWRLR